MQKQKKQRINLGSNGSGSNESDDDNSTISYPSDERITSFITDGNFTNHDASEVKAWLSPPPSDFSLVPPIPGVAIHAGYQCSDCATCVVSKHSIRAHKCCPGVHDFQSVMVQQPLSGVGRRYVRVDYGVAPLIEPTTIKDQLRDDEERIAALGSSGLPSQKQRNAWLRVSEWPEMASTIIPVGSSYEKIVAAINKKSYVGPLEHLSSLTAAYMEKFKTVSRDIDYRFRRLVMGLDEYNRVPSRGLRPHSVQSTSAYYCQYLGNFVAGLLNAELEPEQENMLHLLGNLDAQQAQRRVELIAYLNGRSSNETSHNIVAFHNFLLSLWTPEETSIVDVRASSHAAVLRYLMLSSLKPSFDEKGYGFQHVSSVTGRCSVLIYWMRMTILMELGASLWKSQDDDTPISLLTLE
jgi:hypothetical protein